jgi:hypothetical protein
MISCKWDYTSTTFGLLTGLIPASQALGYAPETKLSDYNALLLHIN